MENILDAPRIEQDAQYIGFGPRLGALLLDGLITAIPLMGLTFYNIFEVKSLALLIAANLAAITYKPLLEGLHGATLGKKALKIKVVDTNLAKAGWNNILLRNVFHIGLGLLSMVAPVMMFTDPLFQDVDTMAEYNLFAAEHSSLLISFGTAAVYIVDLIVMLADSKNRSLHDRIGNTFVVKA